MQVILLSAAATAADPLVATGPDALPAAAVAAGRPEADFAPILWSELVSGPVAVVGEGTWTACAGPRATVAQLALAVDGAESALGYGDLDKARAEAADADRRAACLGEDAPAGLLARWQRVRGVLGDDAAFGLARATDPAMRWPAAWPPERASAFEAASPAPGVPVAVHAWSAPVRVDSAAPNGTLAPGVHMVRADAAAGLLTVGVEPLDLVLTPAYPRIGPSDLADPAIRDDTAALLLVRYGPGTRVFIGDADETWATTAGRTDWSALRRVRRSSLIGVGAGIAAPGLVGAGVAAALAGVAYGDVSRAATAMGAATTTADFRAADADYDAGANRFHTWTWVAVGAGVVGAVGVGVLAIGVGRGEIEVRAVPGGVEVRR